MKKELTINGIIYPVQYGIRAIEEVSRSLGQTIGETVEQSAMGEIDLVVSVTAVALNEGARRKGSDTRYTIDDVVDMIDDDPDGDVLKQIVGAFSEAMQANMSKFSAPGEAKGQRTPKARTTPRR